MTCEDSTASPETASALPPGAFELSPAQAGLWHAQQLLPSVPLCVAHVLDIEAELDVALLERCALVAGHELGSPFLTFLRHDGRVVQRVDHSLPRTIRISDFSDHPDPTAAARKWIDADLRAPIDLLVDEPGCTHLIRVGRHHYWWYSRAHHVGIDGIGAMILLRRTDELYSAARTGTEARPSGALALPDIVERECAYRRSARAERDRTYWQECLTGLRAVPSLSGRVAPPCAVPLVARGVLPPDSDHALAAASDRFDAQTPVLIVATALAYIARMTGARDVVVSLPVAARTTAALRRSAGMVANTVPLRAHVGSDTTVADLVRQVRLAVTGALRHQHYRLEDIRRDLGPAVGGRGALGPVINLMLVDEPLRFGGEPAGVEVLPAGGVEDVALHVYRFGAHAPLGIDLSGNPALYTDAVLTGHHARLLTLLNAVVAAEPDTLVCTLPMLTPSDEANLHDRAGEHHETPSFAVLPDILAEGAARARASAVEAEGVRCGYAELDGRSSQWARELIAAGAGPETVVAVLVDRSLASVLAFWAVAKTGATWMPIDPATPEDRVARMLADARPVAGLTVGECAGGRSGGLRWIAVDDPETCARVGARPSSPVLDSERTRPLHSAHPAYLIYTSGTTGSPKGVSITHRGLANLTRYIVEHYRVRPCSRVLLAHAPGFDAALLELLAAFGAGATMVVCPPEVIGGSALTRLLSGLRITHYLSTPAVLATVDPAALPELETVVTGAEACPRTIAAAWSERHRLINSYGPTETTVIATQTEPLGIDGPITIGTPAAGAEVVVLDRRLQRQPREASGELYVSGPGIARGYHRSPALTATHFVADPYGPAGSRMYRTGDLARRRLDGAFDYHGRGDSQISLRGIRVEPHEIESALADDPQVARAAVAIHPGPSGDVLVAYLVPAGAELAADSVLSRVRRALPQPLVPTTAIVLPELPRTANGKLDRAALPAPVLTPARHRAPRTPTEEAVAATIAQLLGIARAGRDDDFFALGGHSLAATQLASRLSESTGAVLGVRDVFEHPTVAALARRIDAGSEGAALVKLTRRDPRPGRIPLAPAQRRLWIANQLDPDSPAYNMPFAVRLDGPLDTGALTDALRDVLERHEPLRTVFPADAHGPTQRVLPVDEIPLDLSPRPIEPDELGARLAALASAGFDASVEPCFRVTLLRLAPSAHVLVLVLHHLVADGWSMRPLARDLGAAYAARHAGDPPGWSPLPVSYADYALWHTDVLGDTSNPDSYGAEQIRGWQQRLTGLTPERVPASRPGAIRRTARGDHITFTVDPVSCQRLSRVAHTVGATDFMAYQALTAVWLQRLSGGGDTVVATPTSGRGDRRLDALVGMFVNTILLRAQVEPTDSFRRILSRVRDFDIAAFAQSDVPYEQVVAAIGESDLQPAQTMLIVETAVGEQPTLPGLRPTEVPLELSVARFDVDITLTQRRDSAGTVIGVDARLGYAADLFSRRTAEAYARMFSTLATTLAEDPDTELSRLAPATPPVIPSDPPPPVRTLPELLAAGAHRNPDGLAIRDGDRALSYRALESRAARLARELIELGVGPEQIAAVAIPRSLESVLAWWAVTMTGAATLMIDPEQPRGRIATVMSDARPVAGVTFARHAAVLPQPARGWVVLDDPETSARIAGRSPGVVTDAERTLPLHVDHPAYVTFTSGTTGRPKGVTITHRGLAALTAHLTDRYRVGADARIAHAHAPVFDASLLELFAGLSCGATLIVVPPGIVGGAELTRLLARERVTHYLSSPVVLSSLDAEQLTDLRTVVTGGEPVDTRVITRWAHPQRRLINSYGPTEATVVSTQSEPLTPGGPVSIGAPIPGVGVLPLDRWLALRPPDVPGELYLAGPSLARGYHRDAAATAARFVANPYGPPGSRMYRTGDLVCRWDNGRLDYHGRVDNQINLRGHRIEPGEIESLLAAHPQVSRAAVAVYHQGLPDARMVAYLVPENGAVDADDVLARVRELLPSHLVPASACVVAALPTTPAGKLDRAALPAPAPASARRPASGDVEKLVVRTVSELLGVEDVAANDNLFALGLHSLTATELAGLLRARTATPITVRDIYTHSTPESLAVLLDRGVAAPDAADPDAALRTVLPIRATGTLPALWCIHSAIGLSWSFAGLAGHLDPETPIYGLQMPQLTDPAAEFDSIEELADHYLTEIRAHQPHGPYSLLGWSLGGSIAHAIAVRLRADGQSVALLAMLDSAVLTHEAFADDAPDAARIRRLLNRFAIHTESLDDRHRDRLCRAGVSTIEMARRYSPARFPGDLLYFGAAGRPDPDLGVNSWRPFIEGTITTLRVPADHDEMTSAAALEFIGPRLRTHMPRHPHRVDGLDPEETP
ncbi:non-ribosomal peptide synthetase [Nocardia violaceofusca]|uniref:non-ribosomal peptide synthetase n=1 Tax=Nocardia violaceofusca TaxID=941182 RepID=UPI0007A52AC5|nr:non-ribosomal peptide synthetase [Nocardia violaceofusca]